MPRANRYYVPGCIWHITHRCHKSDFLLKFARDRRRWVYWLLQARKRHGLNVLNFMVTSNHIHLLVVDGKRESSISQSLQLVASRTGQEYNARRIRKGAFWEDRYHATAVESGEHLQRCMAYIDMNMCRAGVAVHPKAWECCGYHNIQNPPHRYRIVDRELAAELLGFQGGSELAEAQNEWITTWQATPKKRNSLWTESLAVGSTGFLNRFQSQLGFRARYRQVDQEGSQSVLRETSSSYSPISGPQMEALKMNNTFEWELND